MGNQELSLSVSAIRDREARKKYRERGSTGLSNVLITVKEPLKKTDGYNCPLFIRLRKSAMYDFRPWGSYSIHYFLTYCFF